MQYDKHFINLVLLLQHTSNKLVNQHKALGMYVSHIPTFFWRRTERNQKPRSLIVIKPLLVTVFFHNLYISVETRDFKTSSVNFFYVPGSCLFVYFLPHESQVSTNLEVYF